MVEISVVIACAARKKFWDADEPAKCAEDSHDHQRHELHRHRDRVELPDGTSVTAVSFE